MKSESETSREQEIQASEVIGNKSTSNQQAGVLRKAVTSESFVEKAALLLLTIILSGIIVPLIINHFNSQSAERQKAIEAMKARDAAIFQAQSKLLNDLSETILTYETLALDVSWYGSRWAKNQGMHQKEFARYSERVVDLISKWRTLSSQAQTLASPAINEKVNKFLEKVFAEQDTPMVQLYNGNASEEQWDDQHRKNMNMIAEANSLLADMANDLGLSKANLHQAPEQK